MFKKSRQRSSSLLNLKNSPFAVPSIEGLENRQFLSVAHHSSVHSDRSGHGGGHGGGYGGGNFGDQGSGKAASQIEFSLTPTVVQSGLTSLASTDGDTAPTSTTEVRLGNRNGVETYSISETSTGTDSTLTVDSTGAAITASTKTSTTYGAITNTAVTSEISAIATALDLTAPTSTTTVTESTASDGTITYSIGLTSTTTSTTTTSGKTRTTHISVDSSGNPIGSERVPLSVLSTAIQNGLTSNAPSGATALASTSLINVSTEDGVTLYSTTYTTTGTKTKISVDSAGALTSGTTRTSVDFSTLPSVAQTELQTLATAEDVATTIASTQSVTETTEANGTVLYSVKLTATSTSDSSDTYTITLTVDAAGNPTVADGSGAMSGGFGGNFGGGSC